MNEPFISTDYGELLKEIDELIKSNKENEGYLDKLRKIIISCESISIRLKEIVWKGYPKEDTEEKLWNNYQRLQNDYLSVQNLRTQFDSLSHYEGHNSHLFRGIENAISENTNYLLVLIDSLKAHIDILEIKNSRENRKIMRNLGILALGISAVSFYMATLKDFVLYSLFWILDDLHLPLYLAYVITIVLLIPFVYLIIRAWRYVTKEQISEKEQIHE